MTKIAVMQPYFFPYIGYFQLINSVDIFVLYDDVKYTKKGWINRNRIFQNNGCADFTLPLKRDSDSLSICERYISEDFNAKKMLNKIKGNYHDALNFKQTYALIDDILSCKERNLFNFLFFSILKICNYLNIKTKILKSSNILTNNELSGEQKIFAICKKMDANFYLNAEGGVALYSKERFAKEGLELNFIKSLPFEYRQSSESIFVPLLSIIDVLMFNSIEDVTQAISTNFEFT